MPRRKQPEARRYGSGTISKRPNGRFQAQFFAEGQRTTRTFDTERQADAWLTRLRAQRLAGELEPAANARLTTGELLDWWYATYCATRPASTRKSYAWGVEQLAKPLRAVPASRLRVDRVQRVVNDLHEAGRSRSTIEILVTVLTQAFTRGVADLRLSRVPTVGLQLPEKGWTAAASWSLEQARTFLAVAEQDELALFWRLLFATGLRQGELRGLRWEAVDQVTGFLRVWYQLDEKGQQLGLTKNRRRRTLALDQALLGALQAHHAQQGSPEGGYVFLTAGQPFKGDQIRRRFARLMKAAGLSDLTPHGARHTAASALREQGADLKDVQEILGHSALAITADIYTHQPADRQIASLRRLASGLAQRGVSGAQVQPECSGTADS